MLGENVVASRERAKCSSLEMTPRRRGVILKTEIALAEVDRLATTFMFRELCGSGFFDKFGPQAFNGGVMNDPDAVLKVIWSALSD